MGLVVFDPDRGRGPRKVISPLLAVGADHSHHRACDAVVWSLVNGRLKAVFIELKSSNPSGYINQFKGARCFLHYLIRVAKEFHGIEFGKVEERFVVFHGPKGTRRLTLNKKPTRPLLIGKPSAEIDKPSKELVSDGQRIPLKALLS